MKQKTGTITKPVITLFMQGIDAGSFKPFTVSSYWNTVALRLWVRANICPCSTERLCLRICPREKKCTFVSVSVCASLSRLHLHSALSSSLCVVSVFISLPLPPEIHHFVLLCAAIITPPRFSADLRDDYYLYSTRVRNMLRDCVCAAVVFSHRAGEPHSVCTSGCLLQVCNGDLWTAVRMQCLLSQV